MVNVGKYTSSMDPMGKGTSDLWKLVAVRGSPDEFQFLVHGHGPKWPSEGKGTNHLTPNHRFRKVLDVFFCICKDICRHRAQHPKHVRVKTEN